MSRPIGSKSRIKPLTAIQSRLAEIIQLRGLEYEYIATEVGISRSTLYRSISDIGGLKLRDFVALCNVLKISPYDLIPEQFSGAELTNDDKFFIARLAIINMS
jgi:transcriptional regulator with XRE-family HTH domain